MNKFYLITLGHHSQFPINHGQVYIDDQERIDGRIPVANYGLHYMRQDKPFPTDPKEMLEIFTQILTEREN